MAPESLVLSLAVLGGNGNFLSLSLSLSWPWDEHFAPWHVTAMMCCLSTGPKQESAGHRVQFLKLWAIINFFLANWFSWVSVTLTKSWVKQEVLDITTTLNFFFSLFAFSVPLTVYLHCWMFCLIFLWGLSFLQLPLSKTVTQNSNQMWR